jgi:hypothetical protein
MRQGSGRNLGEYLPFVVSVLLHNRYHITGVIAFIVLVVLELRQRSRYNG